MIEKGIYEKNTNAGTAKMTVKGIGAYSGSITKSFKINPYDITKDSEILKLTQSRPVVKYCKGGAFLDIEITSSDRSLVEGKDYKITYYNNKKPAQSVDSKAPYAIVSGLGNYKGSVTINFSIIEKSLDDKDSPVSINVPDMPENSGKGKYISKPVIKDCDGKVLKFNTDYTVKYYKEETDKTYTALTNKSIVEGSAIIKAQITGKGYYTGTVEVLYRVHGKAFSKTSIKAEKKQYTGSAVYLKEKDLTVTYGKGKDKVTLKYGRDYEIVADSYINNLKTGTAQVTIKGIGEYSGQKTVKFKIYKRLFK